MKRRLLMGALMTMALTGIGLSACATFGKRPSGERRARMERSPQWKDGRFVNPQPIVNDTWGIVRDVGNGSEHRVPTLPVPTEQVDPRRFDAPPPSGLRVTWLGHSTLLVELDGRRVLFDPVWGERSSPFSSMGPKRWYPPLVALDRLPRVDAVVISHDHFDHLDMETIQAIKGWDTVFVAPLGVGAHLAHWGVPEARIVELDWWDRHSLGGVELVATPARHASGRWPLSGMDRTLWAGYALLGPSHRVFYGGDTGLFPGLTEIGERLGPFDLAMLEAGAYGRHWPDWHLGPEQAVLASRWVRAEALMPVHWGLFNLAHHGWTEPAERILAAAAKAGLPVTLPKPGQSIEPAALPPLTRWWPALPWKTAEEDPIVSSQVTGLPETTSGLTPSDHGEPPGPAPRDRHGG
jgi:L-ascorbate metabolism protein UlaG (beta-lactamase superfamily)